MSTPISSTPRGTPGLSVPASQNTAPVIKFRCLYTHDLRRKAKRWQDGYLRYHTFNKRIMAFDISGNFIGDLHWRQDEEIQDGDEMELDKGVLIQVGELMGKTETDISTLFEKKRNKSSQGSPSQPTNPPASSSTSTVTSTPASAVRPSPTPVRSFNSSQPPRSLNDLLGIKRTPIGHLVSPYEQRHPTAPPGNRPQPGERAPKRQKTAPTEDRPRERHRSPPVRADPVVVDLEAPEERPSVSTREKENISAPKPVPKPAPKPPSRSLSRLVESVESRDSQPSRAASNAPVSSSAVRNTRPAEPVEPVEPRDSQPPSRAISNAQVASSATKNTRPEPAESTRAPPNNASSSASRSFGSSNSNDSPPVNTLRMSTDRPRKKLMYSELLRSRTSKSPSEPAPRSQRSSPQLAPERTNSHVKMSQGPMSTNLDYIPSESTQFALDEMVDDTMFEPAVPARQSSFPLKGETVSQSYEHKPIPPTTNRSNPMKHETSSPPVKSEQLSQPGPNQMPPPPLFASAARPQNPTARASNTGLRKAYSDPTALLTATGIPPRRLPPRSPLSMPVDNGPEQGPWTSEALDLFDYWPPGRPKPT